MDTSKIRCLNSDQVEQATLTLRTYKHRNCYKIIDRLLDHGPMSSDEIASHLQLGELYISKQLEVLCSINLVHAEHSEDGTFFSANEPKLLWIKEAVLGFNNNCPV
jgi:predicted transcriptional regulator